jgi:hypothetical protein
MYKQQAIRRGKLKIQVNRTIKYIKDGFEEKILKKLNHT